MNWRSPRSSNRSSLLILKAHDKWSNSYDQMPVKVRMKESERNEHKKRDRSLSWGKHDRCTQIRGVWGKSWVHNTARRSQRGWLNGADDTECHETLSHPASARFLVYSL